MAIRIGDKEVFNYTVQEWREALWIAQYIPQIGKRLGKTYNIKNIIDVIEGFSSEKDIQKSAIEDARQKSRLALIPIDNFAWVLEDKENRILKWLKRKYFPTNMGNLTYPQIDPECDVSSIYDRFVSAFDRWDVPADVKINEINSCKREWANHLLSDNRYKWLDPANEEQVFWAWQYIQLGKDLKFRNQAIQSYSPTKSSEYYESVISVFDCWFGPLSEAKLALDDMKKAWAQQKYRKGLRGKRQCTFVLKEKTKKKLDELAALKRAKLNEVLELLIDEEHQAMFPPKKQVEPTK